MTSTGGSEKYQISIVWTDMCDLFLCVKAPCSTELITWFGFQKNTQDRRKIPEGIWERHRIETQISKELAGWCEQAHQAAFFYR